MTPHPGSVLRAPPLPSLTALRFFAALLVFGFHITLTASPIPPNDPITLFADDDVARVTSRVFRATGYIGVSFFFVLSGFLLTWAAKPGERPGAFWRRRILKLFPNHLVTWALSLLLFAAAFTPLHASILSGVLLHAFSADEAVNVAVNPPAWTLSSELLFYLLFPVFLPVILRITGTGLWYAAAALIGVMVLLQITTLTLIPDTPVSALTPVSSSQFWFGYLFPPTRLPEFLLGAIAARIVLAGRWPLQRRWPVLLLAVAGYVAANTVPFVWSFSVATIIPVTVLIATAAARDAAGHRGLLASAPLQWLGNISFGFYLVQGITIFWVRQQMNGVVYPTPIAVLLILAFFVWTLLAGWALYALVEKPMMDRFARPRRPVPSGAGS
ncbi:acyltransferase [Mycetocola tolaasinivorans]|uniref:Acyltransferase n=1 Tax=Mycetocola tolaasinivorans TaxID=76635 RepID=A0A3L7A9S4_9MICO|nr:acyltransferase [Mycetocola tolaasinivorans]RLP76775.1 acyltransferase [Mycetocola tolaasinivorans]